MSKKTAADATLGRTIQQRCLFCGGAMLYKTDDGLDNSCRREMSDVDLLLCLRIVALEARVAALETPVVWPYGEPLSRTKKAAGQRKPKNRIGSGR